jgi:membrane protein DedA with SNARE-associated domain
MLVHRLGPAGVGLGAALEGETAVVIGGVVAHHGSFNPVAAALAAAAGSFLADQLVFWASRHESHRPAVQRLIATPAAARALHFLERHPVLFCFGFRFIYGLRIAGPAAAGASALAGRTFVVLNALSALVWAGVFTWLGYHFGHTLLAALRPLRYVPHLVIELAVLAVVIGAVIWIARRRR